VPHLCEVFSTPDGRTGGILQGRFRHVHGMIANPFKIIVDLLGRKDEPEVARHRLLERQDIHHPVIDFHFQTIDDFVFIDYPPGKLRIAFKKSLDGFGNGFFGDTAHSDQRRLQRFKVLQEMSVHAGFEFV
jgi:hypothetical protein